MHGFTHRAPWRYADIQLGVCVCDVCYVVCVCHVCVCVCVMYVCE